MLLQMIKTLSHFVTVNHALKCLKFNESSLQGIFKLDDVLFFGTLPIDSKTNAVNVNKKYLK